MRQQLQKTDKKPRRQTKSTVRNQRGGGNFGILGTYLQQKGEWGCGSDGGRDVWGGVRLHRSTEIRSLPDGTSSLTGASSSLGLAKKEWARRHTRRSCKNQSKRAGFVRRGWNPWGRWRTLKRWTPSLITRADKTYETMFLPTEPASVTFIFGKIRLV